MGRWMRGSLWPVKPMKRSLPAFFAATSASMAPPVREAALRIVVADHLVDLHQVDAVGLQPLERLVELLAWPPCAVRPSSLVMRKAFSR